jgi:hypothetical protein
MPRPRSSERAVAHRSDKEKIMDTTLSLDTKIIDPVVITFALTVCFAVTCALAIVATAGVLGQ